MTQKELITLATDNELMDILQEISLIKANLINQTIYEQKTSQQKMKHFAKIIIEELKNK